MRCVEAFLVERIEEQTRVWLRLCIPNFCTSVVVDYLAVIESEAVAATCVYLFEDLFIQKETKFSSSLWDSSILIEKKKKIWGQEFNIASAEHHRNCNNLMENFVQQHLHLVE